MAGFHSEASSEKEWFPAQHTQAWGLTIVPLIEDYVLIPGTREYVT